MNIERLLTFYLCQDQWKTQLSNRSMSAYKCFRFSGKLFRTENVADFWLALLSLPFNRTTSQTRHVNCMKMCFSLKWTNPLSVVKILKMFRLMQLSYRCKCKHSLFGTSISFCMHQLHHMGIPSRFINIILWKSRLSKILLIILGFIYHLTINYFAVSCMHEMYAYFQLDMKKKKMNVH